MRMFYDMAHKKPVPEIKLRYEYAYAVREGLTRAKTFEEFVMNCCSGDGILKEISGG